MHDTRAALLFHFIHLVLDFGNGFFSFFFSFVAVFPFSSFLFFPHKRFGFCCDWAGRFENYLHRGNLFLFLSISICPKS